jgi:hypothetical protein
MNYLHFEMIGRQRREQLLAEAENERLVASVRSARKPNQSHDREVGVTLAKPCLAGQPG